MRAVKITKLGNRIDAEIPNNEVHVNQFIEGFEYEFPEVGRRYVVSGERDGAISTSLLKSIYKHEPESGRDKLILPVDFPDATKLDFPEMKQGDYLLATCNSVYHVRPDPMGGST
jgi:hypothetical protein